MPFSKEDSNINRAGRPKGSQNSTTKELRDAIQNLLSDKIDRVQTLLEEVEKKNPAKALDVYLKLYEFVVPKPKYIEPQQPHIDSIQIHIIDGNDNLVEGDPNVTPRIVLPQNQLE